MDDPPSTPDSERTVRSIVPAYTPLKKYRLYELGDESPSPSKIPALNPRAAPFDLTAIPASDTIQPIQQQEVSVQHSKQDSTGAGSSNHHYPLQATFVPPDSPSNPVAANNPEYEGAQAQDNQRTSAPRGYKSTITPCGTGGLTQYGNSYQSSKPLISSSFNQAGNSADDSGETPLTPHAARERSGGNLGYTTPSRNRTGILDKALTEPRNPLQTSSQRFGMGHQIKTFPQLSQERGLRPWNGNNFDDRWLLQGEKIPGMTQTSQTEYKLADTQSGTSSTPSATANQQSLWGRLDKSKHRTQSGSSQMEPSSNVDLSDGGGVKFDWDRALDDFNMQHPEAALGQRSFVPTPPEAERLDALVRDVQDGKGPAGLPYSPRIIRRYFYERCFGNGDGPEPLNERDATMTTWHRDRPKTFKQMRDELLDNIEDLILYITSPIGQGSLNTSGGQVMNPEGLPELHRRLGNLQLQGRLPETSTFHSQNMAQSSLRQQEKSQADVSQRNPKARRDRYLSDLQRIHDEEKSNTFSMSAPASFDPVSSDSSTIEGQTPSFYTRTQQELSRSRANPLHRNTVAGSGRPSLEQINEDLCLPSNTSQFSANQAAMEDPFNHPTSAFASHFTNNEHNALQGGLNPYWNVTHGQATPAPYNTPERYPFASNGSQQIAMLQYGNQLSAAQVHFLYNQQMQYTGQHPMHLAYGQQYPPQITASGTYSPNGIFLPSDRNIRPAASNRLAPLYAQSGAWQANQNRQTTPTLQQPEWQNRFGPPMPAFPRDNRKLPYVEGSDEMFPQPPLGGGASVRYQNLIRNQPPDLSTVTADSNMPFVETARASKSAQWGVMKIGNIPYNICKSQIISFLGNHAKVITPELGPSVHIIMERATGKTHESFVEFFSTPDAKVWVNVINSRSNAANRLEDRIVEVEVSSQDDLLKELFPKAKNVEWQDGQPVIVQSDDPYNTGFKTFISTEELQILVRHAEQPHRSNYTLKCPNRPYESMISLLSKFPWHATSHYTLGTRNRIFDAALKIIQILCVQIRRNGSVSAPVPSTPLFPQPMGANFPPLPSQGGYGNGNGYGRGGMLPHARADFMGGVKPLNGMLLRELLSAALNAAGFSERQRWELYQAAGEAGGRGFLVSPLARWWPFEALGRKRGVEEDVLQWYAALIASHPSIEPSTIGSPFGNLQSHFQDLNDQTTMDEAGHKEWHLMVSILMHQCQS